MELNLEGKRALVTGSSSGIGEAIAKTWQKKVCWLSFTKSRREAHILLGVGGIAVRQLGC